MKGMLIVAMAASMVLSTLPPVPEIDTEIILESRIETAEETEKEETSEETKEIVFAEVDDKEDNMLPGAVIAECEEVELIPFKDEPQVTEYDPSQPHLTKQGGVFQGPSGKETYYNLNMSGVVNIMRGLGYSEEEYPYWERSDGVKMIGPFVIVAADFGIRPRGTILETSLGTALVCDTGGFATGSSTTLDIAVKW